MARTREFDEDAALDAAIRVFWKAGYDGTSMDMLTEALGIGKPSLYAAFGNKRSLYSKATARYAQQFQPALERAMGAPKVHESIRAYWDLFVHGMPELPGCFLVQSAQACSADDVSREAAARRAESEAAIARRITRAKKEGELPSDVKAADLARYVTTVANGLAVQAASGSTLADRKRTVELAMRALP